MNSGKKARLRSDFFLDALNAEIVSGSESLTGWLRELEGQGGIDSLFEMECYIKGIRSFFDIRYLPMAPAPGAELLERSFADEIHIIQEALRRCESLAAEVVRIGRAARMEFETFIEVQLRQEKSLDYNIGRILEQPTPQDSFLRLVESIHDTLVLIDSIRESKTQDYRVYVSLERAFQREIKGCRYVDMLLSQRFRLQYDKIEKPGLSSLLRQISDEVVRRNAALAFLYLFRLARYLTLVSRDLEKDRPMRPALVLFALIHEEIAALIDFLKSRFAKGKGGGPEAERAAELMIYSLRIESQRTHERELIGMAGEQDARVVFSKMESAGGLLRNCLQGCIITMAQSLDASFDARTLFPSMIESAAQSQRLRQDLWALRLFLKGALEMKEDPSIETILSQIAQFRENSMRYLMYRDYAEFDRFSDDLVSAGNKMDVRLLLRRFASYLETLVQEVSKRSVLRERESLPGQ